MIHRINHFILYIMSSVALILRILFFLYEPRQVKTFFMQSPWGMYQKATKNHVFVCYMNEKIPLTTPPTPKMRAMLERGLAKAAKALVDSPRPILLRAI